MAAETDDVRETLIASAKTNRELSDLAKTHIKQHLESAIRSRVGNLDDALKLKEIAEYLDKNALELEREVIKTDPGEY